MIEFWIGFVGVLMALLGAWVSVSPPKEEQKQFKIIALTAFAVGSVILVVLLWIHTNDNAKERRETAEAQRHSNELLAQSQKEFREFRTEVVSAQKEANKPGSPDEKLDRINETLSKALGRPLPTANPITAPTLSPVAKGTAMLKGGQATTVLTKAVTATSKIQVMPVGNSEITGRLYPTNIVPGVSFDVVSENGADAGKFFWVIYP